MGFIRNIFFTVAICFAMLFAFAEKTHAVNNVTTEKTSSFFTDNTLHADDFLQPQSTHHFIGSTKLEQHYVLKFFTTAPELVLRGKRLKTFSTFYFQDIDRCEKVSLFLFPYHFFW